MASSSWVTLMKNVKKILERLIEFVRTHIKNIHSKANSYRFHFTIHFIEKQGFLMSVLFGQILKKFILFKADYVCNI